MEWILDILTQKIPLGTWVKNLVEFVKDEFFYEFRAFSDGFGFLIDGFVGLLEMIPPLALIALICAIAYGLHRSWRLVALIAAGLLLILNLGYWIYTVQTIGLVLFSTVVCIIIGVPVGILAARRRWLYKVLRPILDLMQTIPPFVYLIPTLMLFGLGVVPGLISTVIFAIPPSIRLTYLGITSVPKQLVEAGKAFGATRLQLLVKVELPHAMPTIMAGITQCIMLSLSMVVIAALVGAAGLGNPVVRAMFQMKPDMGFEAGLSIVIIAIVLDRILRRAEPAGTQRS